MARDRSGHEPSRRKFVKRAVYVAPAILSLAVVPAFAKAGSVKPVRPPIRPRPPIRSIRKP